MAEKATSLTAEEWFQLLDDAREIIVALLADRSAHVGPFLRTAFARHDHLRVK